METELTILFEDDNIIAVDKPVGISTAHEKGRETILSILENRLNKKFFTVHRLDKEVSGTLIFAKNKDAHKYLSILFEQKKINKTYTALVHGVMDTDEGTIDKPIRQFGSGRMGIDEKEGKKSITDYKVIKRFDESTLLEAHPRTGRRHQIRVHLYHIGHPVVGDNSYGDILIQKNYKRLMLHAKSVSFITRIGTTIEISAHLPEVFNKMIN